MCCKCWEIPLYFNVIMIQACITTASYLLKMYHTILYKCLEDLLCNKSKAQINS